MDFMLLNAKYKDEISLDKKALDLCKKFSKIALFSSVQFSKSLKPVIKVLEENKIKVLSSKPVRTNEHFQLLGCDVFKGNLNLNEEPDAYLYVGDGTFHPSALLLIQKDDTDYKPIIVFNPIQKKVSVIKLSDFSRMLKKYKASLMNFLTAKNIGVLISIKPGQQQLKESLKLRKKLKEKNIYFFADNNFDYSEFENFNFIDVWVNSACPRIGFDDAMNLNVAMINLNDAFNAREILSKNSLMNK